MAGLLRTSRQATALRRRASAGSWVVPDVPVEGLSLRCNEFHERRRAFALVLAPNRDPIVRDLDDGDAVVGGVAALVSERVLPEAALRALLEGDRVEAHEGPGRQGREIG